MNQKSDDYVYETTGDSQVNTVCVEVTVYERDQVTSEEQEPGGQGEEQNSDNLEQPFFEISCVFQSVNCQLPNWKKYW